MRVVILGASGLVGHKLLLELSKSFETYGVLHRKKEDYGNNSLFSNKNVIDNIDVRDFSKLEGLLRAKSPDVVLNCVGITKRKKEILDPVLAMEVNAIFPHKLANWADSNDSRIIHFSTDCVFDGKLGNYTEESETTAKDYYGRTKAFGEINYEHTLTIRSSFIGQELYGKTELLDWLLTQKKKRIKGFKNTLYSGVSSLYMSHIVENIIINHPNLSGLYQLALEKPISKYDLLCLARNVYGIDVDIIPDETHSHQPTLNGKKLKNILNISIPSWDTMMEELAKSKELY